MKKITYLLPAGLLFLFSCTKEITPIPVALEDPLVNSSETYIRYTIAKGQQYSNQSLFVLTDYNELKFKVRFDSIAIYMSSDPANQDDINKLYGFSDNNANHHQFSARFGWRWSDKALRLFAYTYNNGIRDSKELGIAIIGEENSCSIKVEKSNYIFTFNTHADFLQRKSTTPAATGYNLYPYFGGDELAPHEINIWIKEN